MAQVKRKGFSGVMVAVCLAAMLLSLAWAPAALCKQLSNKEAKDTPRFIAYYFYTSKRCGPCKRIEQWAEEAVTTRFKDELASGKHVGKVLPCLNAVLGGTQYFSDPPEVMFHHHGRIIKVGAREIAINAVEDEQEADRILEWLKNEINQTWENRDAITPCYTGKTRPVLMEILKLLPKTNCKKCGQPTCMAFAAQVMEGGRGAEHCPELNEENRTKLSGYLAGFVFE